MRPASVLPCVAMVLAGTGGGCGLVGDPCAAPVTGTASYVSASTPPPYHHDWTVELGGTTGTVTVSPGYGSSESWSASFSPDPVQVVDACRALHEEQDTATAPGGGTLRVRWRGDGGRVVRLTTTDERAADRVRAAVPPAAWSEVEGAYERWQATRRR